MNNIWNEKNKQYQKMPILNNISIFKNISLSLISFGMSRTLLSQ